MEGNDDASSSHSSDQRRRHVHPESHVLGRTRLTFKAPRTYQITCPVHAAMERTEVHEDGELENRRAEARGIEAPQELGVARR